MKFGLTSICLVAVAWSLGTQSGADSTDVAEAKRPKGLLLELAKTYEELDATEFNGLISDSFEDERAALPRSPIRVEVRHAQHDVVHLRVYDLEGSLLYELSTKRLGDVVDVSETNHVRGDAAELRYERRYAEFNADGGFKLRNVEGLNGCSFGMYVRSWVGPTAFKPQWLRELSEFAVGVDTERCADRLCSVVHVERSTGPGNTIREEIWIDQELGLIRAWKTSSHGLRRNRTYFPAIPEPSPTATSASTAIAGRTTRP